jgi:hypothetical protein
MEGCCRETCSSCWRQCFRLPKTAGRIRDKESDRIGKARKSSTRHKAETVGQHHTGIRIRKEWEEPWYQGREWDISDGMFWGVLCSDDRRLRCGGVWQDGPSVLMKIRGNEACNSRFTVWIGRNTASVGRGLLQNRSFK